MLIILIIPINQCKSFFFSLQSQIFQLQELLHHSQRRCCFDNNDNDDKDENMKYKSDKRLIMGQRSHARTTSKVMKIFANNILIKKEMKIRLECLLKVKNRIGLENLRLNLFDVNNIFS